jgi:hypothetical protein
MIHRTRNYADPTARRLATAVASITPLARVALDDDRETLRTECVSHVDRVMRNAVLVVLVACGGAPSPTPAPPASSPLPHQPPYAADLAARCARHDYAPAGSPADYTPPVLDGFTIAAPQMCGDTAYIRVTRLAGARRLGKRTGTSGGFSEGCMVPPASAGDCPVINMMVPGRDVTAELERRGWPGGGPGLGPCGDIRGDYDAWNMSIKVLSWAHAAPAVQLVASALERYDIAGDLGVAVVGATCATLL